MASVRRALTRFRHAIWSPHRGTEPAIRQVSLRGYSLLVCINEDVGCQLHCYGRFEAAETELLTNVIRDDAICLDVGANVGYYTILLASLAPRGEVHAFEPVPHAYHLMSASVALNRLKHVTTNNCAVGASRGTVAFQLASDSAYSSLVDTGRRLATRIEVPSIRLDDYCAERQLSRIDFLKVDVEGAEGLVLDGASSLLRNGPRPGLMMLELYDPMLERYGTNIGGIVENLARFSYRPFVAARGRLRSFEPSDHNRVWNVFFCSDPATLLHN